MENINVCIRLKPNKDDYSTSLSLNEKKIEYNSNNIKKSSNEMWKVDLKSIVNVKTKDKFTYDNVYSGISSNIEIFNNSIKDSINSFLKGVNVSIFAYGQTSTGKTYTMKGNDNNLGIIPLSIKYLFDYKLHKFNYNDSFDINNKQFNNLEIEQIKVSYLEIYNESINDLLDTSKKNLELRENKTDKTSIVYVENLTEIQVNSPDIAMNLVKQGDNNKIIAETKANEKSSRSHCIFRISVILYDKITLKKYNPILNLIDLAGSENAYKSKTEGLRLKEGSNINKSLLALSNVIQKLSSNTKSNICYINFRDSKLTRYLQNSLNGNYKTNIICTVSDSKSCYSETLNTLLFAAKAKNIKTCIKVNELEDKNSNNAKIEKENKELKNKIKILENKISQSTCKDDNLNNNYYIKSSVKNNKSKSVINSVFKSNTKNIIKDNNVKETDFNKKDYNNNVYTEPFNLATASKKENLNNNINLSSFNSPTKTMNNNNYYDNLNKLSILKSANRSILLNNNYTLNNNFNKPEDIMLSNNKYSNLNDISLIESPYIKNYSYIHNNNCYNDLIKSSIRNNNTSNYQCIINPLEESQSEILELKKQNKNLQMNYIEALDNKNKQIDYITTTSERIRKDLEENYLKISLENERLKESSNQNKIELENTITKLNISEKRVVALKEEINNLKINANIQKSNANNNNNNNNNNINNSELNSLYIKLQLLNEQINLLQKDNAYMKQQNDNLLKSNEDNKQRTVNIIKSNESLKADNFTLKTQQEMFYKKNLESYKLENTQLKNNINSYKSDITLLNNRLIQRRNEVKELKIENEKIIKRNFNLEYETKIKTLISIKNSLESDNNNKEEIISKLQTEKFDVLEKFGKIINKYSDCSYCNSIEDKDTDEAIDYILNLVEEYNLNLVDNQDNGAIKDDNICNEISEEINSNYIKSNKNDKILNKKRELK